MDELAEGAVGVAEAAGGLLLGEAGEEDGAEGLVLALQGTGGLSEEAAAKGVVHNGWPECEAIRGDGAAGQGTPGPGGRPGANAPESRKARQNQGGGGRGTAPAGLGEVVGRALASNGRPR